jgi:TP901 family phage tail tape measure protein
MAAPEIVLRVKVDLNDREAVQEAVRLSKTLRDTLGDVDVRIDAKGQTARDAKRVRNSFQGVNRAIQAGAVALTGYASAVFLAGTALRELARVARESVTIFAEFDRTITTIGVVSASSARELQEIREEAEQLGSSTEFTASQVAELQLVLARGGFDATEIQALSRSVLDLATVTGEAPSAAAGALTSVLRTFNLEATQSAEVLDILTTGFNNSRLQLEFFTTAFGFVGPVAAEAGLGITDLTALFGFLADRGIRASTAGTSLRQALIDLQNPSSQVSQALGFTVNNAEGLFQAFETLNDQGIASADVFRKTAVPAIDLLRDAADDGRLTIRDFREELEGVEGASRDAARTIRDTLAGDIDSLKSAFEGLRLAVSETQEGGIRRFIQGLTEDLRGLSAALRDQPIQDDIARLEARFTQLSQQGSREALFNSIIPGSSRLLVRSRQQGLDDTQEALEVNRRLTLLRRLRDEGVQTFEEFDAFVKNQDFNLLTLGLDANEGVPFAPPVRDAVDLVTGDAKRLTDEGERLLDLFLKRYRDAIDEIEGDGVTDNDGGAGGGGATGGRVAGAVARAVAPRLRIDEFSQEPVSLENVQNLSEEINRMDAERVELISQGREENERALKINAQAKRLVEEQLALERTRLDIEQDVQRINELEAERITTLLFLNRNRNELSEDEQQNLQNRITALGNEIEQAREQGRLSEAQLESARLQVELAREALFISQGQTEEEETKTDQTLRSISLIANAFDELAQDPFGNTIQALSRLNRLLIRSGEEGIKAGDQIRFGFAIANGVIQDGLDLAIQASRAREEQIRQEFDARIDAAEGFNQVQRELEEQQQEAIRQEQTRQARLQKEQAIFNITLSGLQAIAAALTNPLTAPIVIPFITSLVAAQLAAVAATPIPEFSEGGVLKGKGHHEGGIKGSFGGQRFEAEDGEFMDFDEFGNLVFVNKRSTAAYGKQLRAMHGRTFTGKNAILNAINSKYGRPFDSTPAFFQQGGIIQESMTSQAAGLDMQELMEAIYAGTFSGTSEGIQTVDTNRRLERLRASRESGRNNRSGNRRIFGLNGTATVPTRPGVPERLE